MSRRWTSLLLAGLVVAVGIGLAVGVLAGNRTSSMPSLLPPPDPSHLVRCTSIARVADACRQDGLDVRPPMLGQACARPTGPGTWTARGRTGEDRICAPG
jgi:hypothetical protein